MGALDRVFRSRRPSQERPLAAIIAGLWRNGEQGVEFDASDLTTMFQDAAGTLPCYMPGQGLVDPPVGLLLDKHLGLVRGPEMLNNGDFSAGGTSWALAGQDATHIVTFADGGCRYQSDTTSPVLRIAQSTAQSRIAGRWYEVTVVVSRWVSGSIKTDNLNGAATAGLTLASGVGTFKSIGMASTTDSTFSIARASANVDLTIDSISVRELSGNHAYQTTTTSRPTLSARYNALSASEKFDDAYWGFTSSYAVEKTGDVQDPSGGSNAWKITSTTGSAALNKVVGAGFKNPVYTVILRAGSRNPDILVRNATTTTNLVGGSTSSPSTSGTYGKFTNADLGGGWRKLTIEITSGVATSDVLIIYLGSTGSVATGQYFYAYRAEFREGNDGVGLPEYQRVVDASNYDTTGFPLYLRFDGVDDFLQTASVDFSGTDKLFATAALRKLSDSTAGIVCELSSDVISNNGAFYLAFPRSATVNEPMVGSKGTMTSVAINGSTAYPAPISIVLTGIGDISGDQAVRRVNGVVSVVSVTDQGSGNYGNYPVYIGRRGGASIPFNGRLYSLLIRGAATPDATIAKVERYLNQKAKVF